MFICLLKSLINQYNGRVKQMEKDIALEQVGDKNYESDCCTDEKSPVDIQTLYDLSELFKVFGDSTRLRILYVLLRGEKCVYHIAQSLEMGQSAISHQLRILRAAGLVRPRREGKTVYYSLDDKHIEQILDAGLEHILHKG
jgi:ArsR family transcriptional regulator